MSRFNRLFAAFLLFSAYPAFAEEEPVVHHQPRGKTEIVINIDEQRLKLIKGGLVVQSYPVSTSKFGIGDARHSYKTPLGRFQVCGKIGDNLPPGAVLKGGRFTGEILPVNAPGRDPIVTRIIRLEGLEGQNRRAYERGIMIHGTPEEKNIGKPVSWGCIRMRSRDVIELYREVSVGTPVTIATNGGLLAGTSRPKSENRSILGVLLTGNRHQTE